MLNENIKNLRKQKGLSQEEFAIKLNVVRQTVSKWERGLSVPEAAKLGSVSASYAIEQMGTQEHSFTREDFKQRYEAAYGPMPIEL